MRMFNRNILRTAGGTAGPGAGLDIHDAGINRASPVPRSMRPPTQQAREDQGARSVATFEPSRFGDAQHLVFTFAAAGDQLVLVRPTKGQRGLLVIENDFAAGVIRLNWDSPASATVGIPIGVGGNIFMDEVVPQNDVHIFAPGAGVVQITYINLDATNSDKVTSAV